MNDMLEFFAKLTEKEQLPAFLSGIFLGFSLIPFLIRLFKKWMFIEVIQELKVENKKLTGDLLASRKQVERLQEDSRGQIEKLQGENRGLVLDKVSLGEALELRDGEIETLHRHSNRLAGEYERKAKELSDACEEKVAEGQDLRVKLNKERRVRRGLNRQVDSYAKQLDEIVNSDGRVWEKPPTGPVVPFLPLAQRRTPIISLINLKGGVGKTTLTANLGVALSVQGFRVLLIDLDHQSSLSNLFLTLAARKDVEGSGRFVGNFFDKVGDFSKFQQCVTRLDGLPGPGQLHLAAVSEEFVEVENKLQARWMVGHLAEDVRFRLRGGLHSHQIRDHYDIVLIDCPPRWSTGSVNAIVASDYMMIPVLLEDLSAEAVPRILKWLKIFQSNCCRDLNLLGVVGNKAANRENDRLIARERTTWIAIQEESRRAWKAPIRFFEEVIREHSTFQGPFPALDPIHKLRYDRLIQQIRKEISHGYLEPSAIHPPVGSSVGGGGN